MESKKKRASKNCRNYNFDIVQLYYPNEVMKNISKLLPQESLVENFNWFMCSHRIFDDDDKMYYSSISPDVQFYCYESGKTMMARGLSKKEESNSQFEVNRAKLLILSDPHNKKMLCRHFNYLCGCDSEKDILSKKCNLEQKSKLLKGAKKAVELGYDGVVIQHECTDSNLDVHDTFIYQNVTFIFKKGILESIGGESSDRCGIVKYSKRHNSCIREVVKDFPTCQEIDILLKDKDCSEVSKLLYDMIKKYIEEK